MLTVRSIAWYLISDGIWQSEFYNPCGNFADSQLVPYSVLLCHLNYEIQALHCLLTWPSMRSWDLVIVWWVKNHAKPRSYLAYSRNKTWPWKIMEQTITMKSHKANLTKNRKQPKTKKNYATLWNYLEIYGNQQKTMKLL